MSEFQSKEVWGWAHDEEGEDGWRGTGTRDDAILEAREMLEDDEQGSSKTRPVYVHKGKTIDPATLTPDADDVMERMQERMLDQYGCPDYVEDPLIFKDGAEEALEMLLEAWARQYVETQIWQPVGKAETVGPEMVVEFEETA